jgi:hypothetical protein
MFKLCPPAAVPAKARGRWGWRVILSESPLTPALSPQARLGELASQRGRIRKRMRLEREQAVPVEKASPLP